MAPPHSDSISTIAPVPVAVIGGSGLYKLEGLEIVEEVTPQTPWGKPSATISIAQTPEGHRIAFLARHGAAHDFNPSEVPYRANIAALKAIGVRAIIAFSAVGSLREEICPGDFVLPDQVIDRTKGIRASTFFEKGAPAHAPFADPFHANLADMVERESTVVLPDLRIHRNKTLICMEGPAFSTRAESRLYRNWGGDIINMSAVPEAKLAREAEIAYQMVCMATDYDCWRERGADVTVQAVLETMAGNAQKARQLLLALLPPLYSAVAADVAVLGDTENAELDTGVRFLDGVVGCMRFACMVTPEMMPKDTRAALSYILPEYY